MAEWNKKWSLPFSCCELPVSVKENPDRKKMGNNEFEKVRIKKRTSYHFDETMKREDFDIYNILIDGKSRENIFIYGISWKALIGPKSLRIRFNKIDEFI